MLKFKKGMKVRIIPGKNSSCGVNSDCSKCMRPPLIIKESQEGDENLVVWEDREGGEFCSSIPKKLIVPITWRSQYENRD